MLIQQNLWIILAVNSQSSLISRKTMDVTRYDDVLLGVLQHCEQIEPFLEAMFSFLARRTDFFRLMHSRDDKMGFPPGVAEKMVIKVCIYTIAIVGTASLFCTWFGIPWFKNRTSSLLDASKGLDASKHQGLDNELEHAPIKFILSSFFLSSV